MVIPELYKVSWDLDFRIFGFGVQRGSGLAGFGVRASRRLTLMVLATWGLEDSAIL